MDSLREEDRGINHHGTILSTGEGSNAIQVRPADSDLIARREDVEVDARKKLYEQIEKVNKNKNKLARCKNIGHVYLQAVVVVFSSVYWGYGLSQMA